MAYVQKPLKDEEENDVLQGTEGEGVKQLSQTEGVMTPGGVAEAGQLGTGQTAAPTGGQEVSTQQKYLEANKQKALELAGKTAGVIRGDITGAQEALTGAGQQFQEAVTGATQTLDPELYKRATESLVDQAGYQTGAAEQFLQSPEDAERFKELYSAAYEGPRDIYTQDYYAEAQREAEKAQRTASLIEDLTGRQELIARTYDRPSGRFSTGTLALDEALLSGNKEAYEQLVEAVDTGLGLEEQMAGLGETAQRQYEEGKATTEATREAMRKQFSLSQEEQELRDYTQSVRDQAKLDYENYLKYVGDTYGVQEGISATDYFDRPQDYLNIQATNVASAEDYARLAALEELTGGVSTLTPFQEQAGQYSQYIKPEEDFRLEDFQQKVEYERQERIAREEAERQRLEAIAAAQRAAEEAARKKKEQQEKAARAAAAVATGGISLVCFPANTDVTMKDNRQMPIHLVQLGDELLEGGKVYSVSKHINKHPLYNYEGVLVSGSHAVKEDGFWTRVAFSNKAKLTDTTPDVLYSLSCENHKMIIKGITFSDFDEVDDTHNCNLEDCLKTKNNEGH